MQEAAYSRNGIWFGLMPLRTPLKCIIFHGRWLVSVGVGDGGKCEQERLSIISGHGAVWWFYMFLQVPDTHFPHIQAQGEIPVGQWSVAAFILSDLHSLNIEDGLAACARLTVTRCSQSPRYRCRSWMLRSLSVIRISLTPALLLEMSWPAFYLHLH